MSGSGLPRSEDRPHERSDANGPLPDHSAQSDEVGGGEAAEGDFLTAVFPAPFSVRG